MKLQAAPPSSHTGIGYVFSFDRADLIKLIPLHIRMSSSISPVMLTESAKATILEVLVSAVLDGHDLGPFEPVDTVSGGYQAVCRKCGKSVWVGDSGVMYSLLGEKCRS